jgi:glucans biosynthesis protein C
VTPASAAPPLSRHYGLDWLRIGAFMLLILHHIWRAFVPGEWLVKLADVEWLLVPMLFVTPWRLALLFVIAGFASRAMLQRLGRRAFMQERSARLLVPLIAAMILVIPPQSWVSLRFNHGYTEGFGHFLLYDAFAFRAYDGVAQPGWEHLWFVAYLWAYTMLLCLALRLLPLAAKARLRAGLDWMLGGTRLLWLPLFYLVPARVLVAFTLGESHGLFDDWVSDVIYLPCFLIGYALAGSSGLWPAVARSWRPALGVALASYAILLAIELSYPHAEPPPHLLMALDRASMAAMMWAMVVALLQLANTRLNRDHPWRARLSEAVFPFYIVHQTAIVVIAWALIPKGVSAGAAFVVILCGTVSACWLFYRLGDLIPAVRPLIGLKPLDRSRTPRPAPAPAAG